MYEQFSWREKRCNLRSIPLFPFYFDTKQTTCPEGNAHYSLYGITKGDAIRYEDLLTKRHVIYEHYSAEIIVDVETKEGLDVVVEICHANDWNFGVYETGSNKTGAHVHINRHAEPSEILYARDLCFVWKYFEGVPDIDDSIYKPMHLIRGIGRINETTKRKKKLIYSNTGSAIPSVQDISIPEILQMRHEKMKFDNKTTFDTNWTKFQRAVLRNNPIGMRKGRRYVGFYAFSRDLAKCGLGADTAFNILKMFNSQLEEPDDVIDVERAVNDAFKSVNRSKE
jgi:hypothetical protein